MVKDQNQGFPRGGLSKRDFASKARVKKSMRQGFHISGQGRKHHPQKLNREGGEREISPVTRSLSRVRWGAKFSTRGKIFLGERIEVKCTWNFLIQVDVRVGEIPPPSHFIPRTGPGLLLSINLCVGNLNYATRTFFFFFFMI